MSLVHPPLTPVQAELLKQILSAGNHQIAASLQMLLGKEPNDLTFRSSMQELKQVALLFGNEPLVTVKIAFDGDIRGNFLLLTPAGSDLGLRSAIKDFLRGELASHATDYNRRDWVKTNRESRQVSDRDTSDALGELANVLLGGYLTAIYSRCVMTTYHEIPTVRLADLNQSLLRQSLAYFTGSSNRAFVVEVDCRIAEHKLHFWLIMMGEPAGFRVMLDNLQKRAAQAR